MNVFNCLLSVVVTSALAFANGTVKIDGSSTSYPITEAVAEEYAEVAPKTRVTVGVSGTGGGFKRLIANEIDISNASRPIKEKEREACKEAGIEFLELPVAYDGLTIVVNKKNTWVDSLTMHELNAIFEGGLEKWSDIRPEWPDSSIKIFSPGTDSGTFDYFKEVVIGKTGSMRSDMSVSEDDNVLVKGVAGSINALGFFGCSYYYENVDKLKVVPIVNPKSGKKIIPSKENIESGAYYPFSRPLFIYVNKASLRKHSVRSFVMFYLEKCSELSVEVGYVRMPPKKMEEVKAKITR